MSDIDVSAEQKQNFNSASLQDSQVVQGGNIHQQKTGDVTGNVLSGNQIKIDEKNKIINNYISKSDKRFKVSTFSLDEAIHVTAERLDASAHTFIYHPVHLEDLKSCLRKYRILLLTGEPETGKNFTAISLAYLMMKEVQNNHEIQWYDLFLKEIDVDPMNLVKNKKSLKGKILVFKDVFSSKKQGIMNFFRSCSREQIGYTSDILKELDSFLLFTADAGTFDQYLLSHLAFKREVCPMDHDLLQKAFDLKLKHFCSLSSKRDLTKSTQLLESKKQEILHKLERMSIITLFIENYLDKILSDEKAIDEAIEEASDVKKRLEHLFMKELGSNKTEFEAWTFVLCLSMFNGISYSDFHEIHRGITMLLLEKLFPFKSFKDFSFAYSDVEFLNKCGAYIVKDAFTHSTRIEFRNPEDQKVLFDILMRNNMKILLEIIPFLETYVERHSRWKQRRTAAMVIGRIGVLDPQSLIFPIVDKWTGLDSQEDFQWENVGYIYEGVLSSGDKDYERYCLGKLNSMAFSNDVDCQWTGITAYKYIGLHDLEFAMEQLRKIQEEAIDRMDKEQTRNLLDLVYSQEDNSNMEEVLENIEQIYNDTVYLISYVRYSIVTLSSSVISEPITIDPIDVLHELKKWLHKGNQYSRGNVAVFFLLPKGILYELENIEVVYADEDEKDKKEKLRTNLFLYSITAGEQSINRMADFLSDLYKKSFLEFRLEIRKELKRMLFAHMEMWVMESLNNAKVGDALRNLIFQFYHRGDEELKGSLWNAINNWRLPKDKKKTDNIEKEKEKEAMLNNFVSELKNKIIKS